MAIRFRCQKRRASSDASDMDAKSSGEIKLKKRIRTTLAPRTRKSCREAPFPTVPIQMHTLFRQQHIVEKGVSTRSKKSTVEVAHRICGKSLCRVNRDPPVYTIDNFLTARECEHLLSIISQKKKQRCAFSGLYCIPPSPPPLHVKYICKTTVYSVPKSIHAHHTH